MSADVTGSEAAAGKAEPPVIKPLSGWSPEITPVDKPWFAAGDDAPAATSATGTSEEVVEKDGVAAGAAAASPRVVGARSVKPSSGEPAAEKAADGSAATDGSATAGPGGAGPGGADLGKVAPAKVDPAKVDPDGADPGRAARGGVAPAGAGTGSAGTGSAGTGGAGPKAHGRRSAGFGGAPRPSRDEPAAVRDEPAATKGDDAEVTGEASTDVTDATNASPAPTAAALFRPANPVVPAPAPPPAPRVADRAGEPAAESADKPAHQPADGAPEPLDSAVALADDTARGAEDRPHTEDRPDADDRPGGDKTVVNKAEANKAEANKVEANKVEANKVEANKAVEHGPADRKPVESQAVGDEPVDEKPVDEKPVDEKPGDEKPVFRKPVAQQPTGHPVSLFDPDRPVADPGARPGSDAPSKQQSPFPRPPAATPPGPKTSPFGLPAASPLPGFGKHGVLAGAAADASGATADLPAVVINPAPVFDTDGPPLPSIPSSNPVPSSNPGPSPAPTPAGDPFFTRFGAPAGPPAGPAATGSGPGADTAAANPAPPGELSANPFSTVQFPQNQFPQNQGPQNQFPQNQGPQNQFPTEKVPTEQGPVAPSGEDATATQASWYSNPLFTEGPPRLPRWTTTAVVGGAIAVGVLIYIIIAFLVTRSVPDGTVVGGLPIGGLGHDDAVAAVQQRVDAAVADGVVVLAGDSEHKLDPSAAGLTTDAEGLVDGLAGFTLDPRAVWRHLGGSAEVRSADSARLTTAIEKVAEKTDQPPKNATVEIRGTSAVVRDGETGQAVDVPGAVRAVADRWLAGSGPITLPTRSTEPTIAKGAAERAKIDQVEPALAAPLKIVLDQRSVKLEPKDFAPALSVAAGDAGGLELAVDGEKLRKVAVKKNPDLEQPAKDATVVIRKGKPKIVKGVTGRGLAVPSLAEEARAALAGDRIAIVEPATVQPKLTTDDVKALGIVERVSTFATNLTANAGRTQNLRIAARTVNNTLVLPGETFSLNGVLGERTPEKGYNEAPAINRGRLVLDHGGGVSQMATTIFNNVFFSGLEDVYHKPHSFYISRYPVGREATVNWPTVDLKWKNDSPYGVLIQAWVDDQVHVSFWSTKVWDVKSITGPRTNYRTPKTIYDDSDGCVSQDANPGFDVRVTRVFNKDGKEVKRETFSTTYIAEDRVVCGPDPTKPKTKTNTGPGAGSGTGTGEDDAPTD